MIKFLLKFFGLLLIISLLSSPLTWIVVGIILLIKVLQHFKNKKINSIHNEVFRIILNNKEINSKLEEFILQHTRRYDNDIISLDDYLQKIDLFIKYINNRTSSDINITEDIFTNEIKKYLNNNKKNEKNDLMLDLHQIKKLIDSKKMEVYSVQLKKELNINNHKALKDVVKKYVDIYGENGLKEINLRILSDSLDEDYKYICSLINKEYTKVKQEYEMRNLESQLFKSNTTLKDMEYIDKLSGYDFEDYLKELFTKFGYTARELPYSNDYGADLIISKGFNEIVIQAKNYTGNVGNKAVQEVIAAKIYYKCDIGMVITNSYYTQNAIKTAEASEIILVNREGLERIINEGAVYFNSLLL